MLHELGDGDVGPVALGPVHELGDQIPTLRPAEAPICSSGRSFPAAVHISFTNPAVVEMPASTKQPAPMSRAHFLPLQRGGGDLAGHYMEQQCRDFEKLLAQEIAARAIRVEPLPDDRLLGGMTNGTTFEVDSDRIKPGFHSTPDKIPGVVNKSRRTRLTITDRTDSTDSNAYNQGLSDRLRRGPTYHRQRDRSESPS